MRKFRQAHVDGNDAEVERCSGQAPIRCSTRCAWRTTAFRDSRAGELPVPRPEQSPIQCPPGPATLRGVPWGTVDRTWTDATTIGGSLQATNDDKIFGHDNHFTIGGSIDHSWIRFPRQQRARLHLSGPLRRPERGDPRNRLRSSTPPAISAMPRSSLDAGIPTTASMSPTRSTSPSRLSVTAGGRFNVAQDQDGRSARHQPRPQRQPHLQPLQSGGRASPARSCRTDDVLRRIFGGEPRSDAARARLLQSRRGRACSKASWSPIRRCKQVVARTCEAGLRGNVPINGRPGRLEGRRCSAPTAERHHPRREPDPGPRRIPERRRRRAARASRRAPNTGRGLDRYTPITPSSTRPTSSPARSRRRTIRRPTTTATSSSRPASRFPASRAHQIKVGGEYCVTPKWKVGADVDVGRQPVYRRRRRQPERQGRRPTGWPTCTAPIRSAKEVQVYRAGQQPVQSEIRDLRHLFRAGGGRQRDRQSADRPRARITPAQPLAIYVGMRAKLVASRPPARERSPRPYPSRSRLRRGVRMT